MGGAVAAAVKSAAPNALVFGIGMKNAIINATYSEAAHVAIPGISGGGKVIWRRACCCRR